MRKAAAAWVMVGLASIASVAAAAPRAGEKPPAGQQGRKRTPVREELPEAARKEADLVASVGATLRFLGPLFRDRQVALETGFPAELRLLCAPGALNQAVANLVTNAVHACSPGGTVRVSLGREGGCARIRVEDDGCGIAPADLPRVFDPFFTTKPVGEGVGLGLCMVHQVVEHHRGRIEIESAPGQGTRVTVVLPEGDGGVP